MSDEQRQARSSEQDPGAIPGFRHIVAWVKQDAFWYEVFRNVVSAALIGLLAFLFALATGYVKAPERREPVVYAGFLVYMVLVITFVSPASQEGRYWRLQTGFGIFLMLAGLAAVFWYTEYKGFV